MSDDRQSTRAKLEAILDDPTKPFGLLTKVVVKNRASGDRLAASMQKVIAASRKEPGNLAYHVDRDGTDPTIFYLYDRWASTEAVETHENSQHFEDGLVVFKEVVQEVAAPVVLSIVDPIEQTA